MLYRLELKSQYQNDCRSKLYDTFFVVDFLNPCQNFDYSTVRVMIYEIGKIFDKSYQKMVLIYNRRTYKLSDFRRHMVSKNPPVTKVLCITKTRGIATNICKRLR